MATAREDLERIGLLKIGDIAGRRSEGEEAGTDRRILKTRRAIRDALISILEEKEIGSITIKEIAERASVNRKTFYAHYASIAELISELEDDIVEAVRYILRSDLYSEEGISPRSFVAAVNSIYESNPTFFENMMTVRNYAFLAEKLTQTMREELIRTPMLGALDPLLATSLIEFYAGGMINLYVNWIRTGKSVPFEAVTRLAFELTVQGVGAVLPLKRRGGK